MGNKIIELTDKERQEIYLSLSVRCGFIETETMHRAVDMEKCGQKDCIKVLSVDQMRMIVFLEDLMKKIL